MTQIKIEQFKSFRKYQGKASQIQFNGLSQQMKFYSMHKNNQTNVCIDNLLKKQQIRSNYADSFKTNTTYNLRSSVGFNNVKLKKQIQPHKPKSSNSLIDQLKLNTNFGQSEDTKVVKITTNKQIFQPIINLSQFINNKSSSLSGAIINNTLGSYVQLQFKVQDLKVQSRKAEITYKNSNKLINQKNITQQKKQEQNFQEQKFNTNRCSLGKYRTKITKKNSSQTKNDNKFPKSNPKTYNLKSFYHEKINKNKNNQKSIKLQNLLIMPLFPPQTSQKLYINQQGFQFFEENNLKIKQNLLNVNIENFSAKSINVMLISKEQQLEVISQKQSKLLTQIASITKIMTCLLALNIAEKFNINIHSQKIFTSQKASKMQGTSASLLYSDKLSVYQALHGLMLPSGNDAAVAIAQWGGKTIRKYCQLIKKYRETKSSLQKSHLNNKSNEKSFLKLFIYYMNKSAQLLSLNQTYFSNSHGLMNSKSYSTANDVTKLTYIALNNPQFKNIVGRQQYSCKIFNRTYNQYREVKWSNTNKLLGHGFEGVKTGITPNAGPCLVSLYRINDEYKIIITVLKCKSMEMRFTDTIQILKEILLKLSESKSQEQKYIYKKALGKLEIYQKIQLGKQNQDLNNIQYDDEIDGINLNDSF